MKAVIGDPESQTDHAAPAIKVSYAQEADTEADQDRRLRRSSSSRHPLPAGRGCSDRPDGQRHPRRHPPPPSASHMGVTAILTATAQKAAGHVYRPR